MTSIELSRRGILSISPFRNATFSTPNANATARTELEDRFARFEFRQGRGIAAPRRCQQLPLPESSWSDSNRRDSMWSDPRSRTCSGPIRSRNYRRSGRATPPRRIFAALFFDLHDAFSYLYTVISA